MRNRALIAAKISYIYDIFDAIFDHSWLYAAFDENLLDPRQLGELRTLFALCDDQFAEPEQIRQHIDLLKSFLACISENVVPVLKELLKISNLVPNQKIMHKEHRLRMQLLYEVIPANIRNMQQTAEEICDLLKDCNESEFLEVEFCSVNA